MRVEIEPVGAIVRSWLFLKPYFSIISNVSSSAFDLINSLFRTASLLKNGNGPSFFASSADAFSASFIISLPI